MISRCYDEILLALFRHPSDHSKTMFFLVCLSVCLLRVTAVFAVYGGLVEVLGSQRKFWSTPTNWHFMAWANITSTSKKIKRPENWRNLWIFLVGGILVLCICATFKIARAAQNSTRSSFLFVTKNVRHPWTRYWLSPSFRHLCCIRTWQRMKGK